MNTPPLDINRRALLRALSASGLLAGIGLPLVAHATNRERGVHLDTADARIRGGTPRDVAMDFHVRREGIPIAAANARAITVNGSTPGPLVELWQGRHATLNVINHLDESTSMHWHGLLLPYQMDGVPGVGFPGIDPGTRFTADFPVRQAGTYWYHSHSNMQEQVGQIGPMVIHPAEPERITADRDYVIVLSDWSFEDPHKIHDRLKAAGEYYNFSERTVDDFVADVRQSGWQATLDDRLAWSAMRMSPRDIADVTGATYTYLMNGQHAEANWTALFSPGERVRLRVINASAMTYFNVRLPGLPGLPLTVIEADGQPVEPVETDEFQIGVAETYDILVTPEADRAYTIMAESMDRSGFARGTLAPRPGQSAAIPPLRAQPTRTMIDMGMAMDGMDGAPKQTSERMPMAHGEGHSMAGMDNGAGHAAPMAHDMPNTMESAGPVIAHHGPDGHGPGNINVANAQRDRLGEPGTGLADVDHRVLTYRQLRSIRPMADTRTPSKTIELHLTGNMERYMWSFDGVKYSDSGPIDFPYGERIRLILVNDTMMEHPIHLHGMFMALENDQGAHLPHKHTVSVLPGSRASLLVTASEPGRWAFHCHLQFHMDSGMFRVVRVGRAEDLADASGQSSSEGAMGPGGHHV